MAMQGNLTFIDQNSVPAESASSKVWSDLMSVSSSVVMSSPSRIEQHDNKDNDDGDSTTGSVEITDEDSQELLDRALALSLQEQFNQSLIRQAEERDEPDMSTSTGKALHFTRLMIANHDGMIAKFICDHEVQDEENHPAYHFSLVNMDDMVFLAERVFRLQEQFAENDKDFHVDIGKVGSDQRMIEGQLEPVSSRPIGTAKKSKLIAPFFPFSFFVWLY